MENEKSDVDYCHSQSSTLFCADIFGTHRSHVEILVDFSLGEDDRWSMF
jgi:hypothetical protein